MDKIWDRKSSKSEVIGRCGGDEKPECPRRTDKSRMLKKTHKKLVNGWYTMRTKDINYFIFSLFLHIQHVSEQHQV